MSSKIRGTVMREVDLEVCSSRIVDSAFGIVEADGRAKGFPMDKAKAGANIPKPCMTHYVKSQLNLGLGHQRLT